VPTAAPPPGPTPLGPTPPGPGPTPPGPCPTPPTPPVARTAVRIRFTANRDHVFKSFAAIANLADRSDDGKINITVEGHAAAGFDQAWLRNAVEEPLDEANIDGMQIE